MFSLSNPFTLTEGVHWRFPLSMLLYINVTIKYLQFSRIKQVQTGDHEMKILNFPDDNTISLLRDINCSTRIQWILKWHKKVSSSKTNFSKFQVFWAGAYKKSIDKLRQLVWSQLYIKILGVHFVNCILDNHDWDK